LAGYTRQTTFIDANTIEAADHNSEFNAVEAVFANTTGHSHDGTPSEGPVIGVIGDIGTTTPLNKVLIDTVGDTIGFWVDVASSSVKQISVSAGVMGPFTDSTVDLGTTAKRFKTLWVDDITFTDAATTRTNLGVDVAGTDNSTSVTLAGAYNYLTIVGQEITLAQVGLTTDVTGTLPLASGGTNATTASAARSSLGVDVAGTDNSTDVTLSGTPTYITLSGQDIVRGQIDLTTDVTGDLPVTEGGTGSSTASGARANLGVDVPVTVSGTPNYITLNGQDIVRGQIDLTTDVTGVLPAANSTSRTPVSGYIISSSSPNTAVAITGVGFTPSYIKFETVATHFTGGVTWKTSSTGYYDGTSNLCIYDRVSNSSNPFTGTIGTIWWGYYSSSIDAASATITSLDSDGFTYTTSSSTNKSLNVIWTAYA
tara:strand:+ start:1684 stop:2961 length:1278 start_codon:yes stop_codon:yes gene_type:complete